ncbi:MAG: AAA family ATPase [Calditrichia bacterium]
MIIRKLHLHPFAAASDLEIELDKNLNVLLGPNEAGKSTLVNALKLVLFAPVHPGKRQFEKEFQRFIPLGGGDTIRVSLGFSVKGKEFLLQKSWGGEKQSRLQLPGGGSISDAAAVQQKMDELLILQPGTFNNVLIAYQNSLMETIVHLNLANSTATRDLNTLLRKAIFETDGISIEKLEQNIREKYNAYLGCWDLRLNLPEKNRGIDNPWKKGVGKVLEAYYRRESLQRELADARNYDREMDELVRKHGTAELEIKSLREYLSRYRPAVEDARSRALLEAQLKSAELEEGQLREISQSWPAVEQELKNRREQLAELEKKNKLLIEEEQTVRQYEQNRRRLEVFQKAKKKKEEQKSLQEKIASMKSIETEDFNLLKKTSGELNRIRTSLKAGKLAMRMEAKTALTLNLTRDLEGEKQIKISAGEPLQVEAGGKILLKHQDWVLQLSSGTDDFENLQKEYSRQTEIYDKLLKRYEVSGLEEAQKLKDEADDARRLLQMQKSQLDELLSGENSYEELEAFAAGFKESGTARPLTSVAAEAGEVSGKLVQVHSSIKENKSRLEQWEKSYGTKEKLLDTLVDKRGAVQKFRKELGSLSPLPDSVESPREFIRAFELREQQLQQREKDRADLRVQIAELEGRAPQETVETLEKMLENTGADFNRIHKEGLAVQEILQNFQEVKKEMDSRTLDPWLNEIKKMLGPLTGSRYKLINLEDGRPSGIVSSNGLEMPFDYLSAATRDGLALALRLSMARYFLRESDGFLVMDDPLVDMDPLRREAAAKIIQEFAREKQVIILTCHPAHAALLAGNRIELPAPDR